LVVGAVVNVASWRVVSIGVPWSLRLPMSLESGNLELASLAGWLCALYTTYVLRVPGRAAVLVAAGFWLFGCLAFVFRWEWWFRDIPEEQPLFFLGAMAIRGLYEASPILVNAMVRILVRKLNGAHP
jgi:hypothetical protein